MDSPAPTPPQQPASPTAILVAKVVVLVSMTLIVLAVAVVCGLAEWANLKGAAPTHAEDTAPPALASPSPAALASEPVAPMPPFATSAPGWAQSAPAVWSPACLSAADAMRYANSQINRLTDYARSPGHDGNVGWQYAGLLDSMTAAEAPLAQAIPLNCPALQPSEISAFRDSVRALDDQMTANGIAPAP